MKKQVLMVLVGAFLTNLAYASEQVCSSADQRIKVTTTTDALANQSLNNANSQVLFDGQKTIFQGSPSFIDNLPHTAISFYYVTVRTVITDVRAPVAAPTIEDTIICQDYSYGK